MKYRAFTLALLLAAPAAAQQPAARPIENADACDFLDIIEVVAFESKGIGQGWIQGVTKAGGNAFKVLHVYRERTNFGDQMNAVVEVYRCPAA